MWLREPRSNWRGNQGNVGDKRGKSNLSSNLADFMHDLGRNLGLNLDGKSNLPIMDDTIFYFNEGDLLNEERPIIMVVGKKRPRWNLMEVEPSNKSGGISFEICG